MTTYYVNPSTGNDANAGTAASPKRYPQSLYDGATLNAGDIVEIQTGTHTMPDYTFLLRLTNYKRGNASSYITLQGAAGCTIICGLNSSGVEGYGSCRFLRFKNLVLRVRVQDYANTNATNAPGIFNEGIFFNGRETAPEKNGSGTGSGGNQNPDGLGAAHISVEGCTIMGTGVSGTGTDWYGRNGFACIGGDYISVLGCIIAYGAENNIGGGGSGISLHQPYSYDSTPGIHMRAERNFIYFMGNTARASNETDRNGIILDQYLTVNNPLFGPLLDHRLVGDTLIANNVIMSTLGRGIHLLVGSLADARVAFINNTVIAPFATNLGGSIPIAAIGGYGSGYFNNFTVFNNLVIGASGQVANNFAFHNWDSGSGTQSLLGSNNWSFQGSTLFSEFNGPDPGSGFNAGTSAPGLVNPVANGTGNYRPSASSILNAKGLASFNGWTAPTIDAYNQQRPAIPSIGAAEASGSIPTVVAPVANFTFAPSTANTSQIVVLTDTSTNGPTSWSWTFTGATASTLQNPVVAFTSAGTKTITLSATNSAGSNSISKTIVINSPVGVAPTADFTFSPATGTTGSPVVFSDTSTGSPTTRSWAFGDGGTATTTNPSHTYATAGTKSVQLTVSNANGSTSVTKSVPVVDPATGGIQILTTNPGFIGTAYVGNWGLIGEGVRFTVSAATTGQATITFRYRSIAPVLRTILVNGTAVATDVTFPATATAFSDNAWGDYPITVGLTSGTDTVEIRINSGVNQFMDLDQITVNNVVIPIGLAPVSNFTYSPPNPVVGNNITFVDTSTNSPTSWAWNFGDTTTSALRNPTHTYNTAGTYQVALTATNVNGSNTLTRSVVITPVVPPPTGGTAINFLTLFKSTYPCSLSKVLYVDGTNGNDSNVGSIGSPLRTIQAALNQSTAGTEITVRAGTYSSGITVACQGTQTNWIRLIADPNVKIGRIDGSGAQPGSSGFWCDGSRYVAIYGFELQGSQDIESGSGGNGNYDTGVRLQNGWNVAIWKCHIHHCGSHGGALTGNQGDFGSSDWFYNVIHDTANWDPFAGSGISLFYPANLGTTPSDGYQHRIIGNIIYKADELIGALTDGNAIILDNWTAKGFTGKGLVAFNLTVGCGGRGVHELASNNSEFYYNTCADNVRTLTGTWDGEISFQDGSGGIAKYNIGAARNGRNRVGLKQGSHDWSQNLFLRGTGGSEGNDPTPGNSNSLDKTSVGPSNYFVAYTEANVVNASDWRPKDAEVATIAPSAGVRAALSPWPDYYGFLRGSGNWAYGAFESPSGTGGGGTPVTAPVANFTVQPTSPTVGVSASFFDTSTNVPTSWAWNFGDGATSAVQHPTHTFTSATSVTYQAENATLVGSTYPGDPFSIHAITDGPGYHGTGYIGFFGQVGHGVSFNISTPTAGPATLSFRYRSLGPQLRTTRVNGVAVATNASIPGTAADWLDDLWGVYTISSVNLVAGVNTVLFSVDTGTDQYLDLDELTVTYPGGTSAGGVFTVSLTATNAGGSSVSQKSITVQSAGGAPTMPVANFNITPTTAVTNAPVVFTDISANTPTSWAWTFTGATASTLQNPTVAFTSAGTKTVQLTATNAAGSHSTTKTIVITTPVGAAPVANFSFTASPIQNQSVAFLDTSTNTPTAWAWQFGDGGTSTAQHPSHTYATAGGFTVTLTASNAGGANQVQKALVVSAGSISAPPVADFTVSSNPTVGQTVTFTDTSSNNPTSWTWNFNVPSVVPGGETFTGADGSELSTATWTNKRVTTGGTVNIQSNQASLKTGTLGSYTGKAGIQTINSYGDTDIRGDYIVQGTNEVYAMVGFRSSTSWSTTHAAALSSYWLEFKRNESTFVIYKRVGDTPSTLATSNTYTYTASDVIHFAISASATSLKVKVWKNAESEPSQWALTVPDSSHSSGVVYLAANGGADTVTDDVRFDNIVINGIVADTSSSVLVRVGATWTGTRPADSLNGVISVMETQAQHIIGFGAENGIELNPSLGVYNWGALDPFVQDIIDAGSTKPIIIFCRAPGWMKASGITQDDETPTVANFGNYATLCAAVAARYTNIKYFSVWNEMKGSLFYNNTLNRWNYEDYTSMYNQIWTKVKAVRPDARIGGPYVILQSGASTYYPSVEAGWSHGPTSVTFPGGTHDQRHLDVMTYFRDHALGFDFLSCDGGIENQFPKDPVTGAGLLQYQIPVNPNLQLEKLWGFWRWVRQNIHPTCELINFETYVNQASESPWNYSVAQREDLFIELCRQTALNVPNPNVTYLTWFHPIFKPQVVAAAADFVWGTTESGFRAKVAAWHAGI